MHNEDLYYIQLPCCSLGRRKTLLISIMGSAVSSIAMSFAPEYYSFTILRFFCGAFNMSLFLTGFVLGMLVSPIDHKVS